MTFFSAITTFIPSGKTWVSYTLLSSSDFSNPGVLLLNYGVCRRASANPGMFNIYIKVLVAISAH